MATGAEQRWLSVETNTGATWDGLDLAAMFRAAPAAEVRGCPPRPEPPRAAPPDLPSIRQAAREYHVGERRLRKAVRLGELPGIKLGKRTVRVEREALQDWLRKQRVPTWRDGR